FVLSPYSAPGQVASVALDHTSILQMIAERFDPTDKGYSPLVEARRNAATPIQSAAAALGTTARAETPAAPRLALQAMFALTDVRRPVTASQNAFATGIREFTKDRGTAALAKYPEMAHWLASEARGG